VLDCGTGARRLGHRLLQEPGRKLHLLFTHYHMDHVFGFPFFAPIYTPGYDVRITMPAFSEEEARDKLARYLNGVYHPTRLRELPAQVTFAVERPDRVFDLDGYSVVGLRLNHPGGSVGWRITAGGRSVVYMTDTSPFTKPGLGVAAGQEPDGREVRVIEFLRDADVVVYDTMYELDEYLERMTWGHSYPEYAIALCRAANVKKLVLFHHAPDHDDDHIDAREARFQHEVSPTVAVAREETTMNVEG
jgi:phosphoribosyl 1,2-cyclic phosphodiesterase